MEQSSFQDEMTVRHQFDRMCQIALECETINYFVHMDFRRKHEVMFSEMPETELNRLYTMDDLDLDNHYFQVFGYDIVVRDELIAEALQSLTEKKRNVILMSYFMDMSDEEIARQMKLVRSTIHEHRKRSLELLKNILEESTDEKKK